jgi:hypothetical protein
MRGRVAPNAGFSIACPVSFRRPAFALVAAGLAIFVASILKSEVFPAAGPAEPNGDRIEVPAAAVDDASPAVVCSGNWPAGAFRSAFRGTLTFSDEPGAVARFSFEGMVNMSKHQYRLEPNVSFTPDLVAEQLGAAQTFKSLLC